MKQKFKENYIRKEFEIITEIIFSTKGFSSDLKEQLNLKLGNRILKLYQNLFLQIFLF
jgi:hypothetical protein